MTDRGHHVPTCGRTAENLQKVRQSKPLIHNITNFVVMKLYRQRAAGLRRLTGDGPCRHEVEEMVDHAGPWSSTSGP
jgi:hydroxyethylthiazole kinase